MNQDARDEARPARDLDAQAVLSARGDLLGHRQGRLTTVDSFENASDLGVLPTLLLNAADGRPIPERRARPAPVVVAQEG